MVDVLSSAGGLRSPAGRARSWQHWAVALALLGAHAAAAQSSDAAVLRQELATLKQTIEQLNARLSAVEQQLVQAPATPAGDAKAPVIKVTTTPPAELALEDRWHRVNRGMGIAEIEALLGTPQRTLNQVTNTVWLYSYDGIGNGSVVFAADHTVIDWQSPPFHQWW